MTYGAMRSLERTRDAYYESYRFADVFSQLKRAPISLVPRIRQISGVAAVEAGISHYAALDIPGLDRPAAALLVSLPEFGPPNLDRIVLRSGRLPRRERNELLMSENMAQALHYQVGAKLNVLLGGRKRTFVVAGIALSPQFIYVLGPGQLVPDDRTFGILWLNRSLMEAAYDLNGSFNDVALKLTAGASKPDVIRRLDQLLARYGGTAAYGREDQTSHAFVTQELDQLRSMAFVIPPIFLGVAVFLIHMVMTRLIETEREAIGVLKSFGYSDWELGRHYLKFALVIAAIGFVIGSVGGVLLGRWMTVMYQRYFHFPFLNYQLDRTVIAGVAVVSFAAAIAGTWKAVLASQRLAPAVAMSPPAPPVYRKSLVDRLGLDRMISMPTQMILRHLERWPLRALMTILGLAMAVMLLVTLFFFFDAIDELVDGFYFRSNHQDIVIGLVDVRSEGSRFEALRLPGVRAAEPILQIAARLSHGPLMQRVAITGLDRNSSMHAFTDLGNRPLTLPDNGIVLSDKLASLLQLRRGDRVLVETLEGRRGVERIPVSAIVSENVGLSAYMERSLLAKLVEIGGVNAIAATVDSTKETELLVKLKEFPTIGAVSTRIQAISSLRDTMARSMIIVIDFYIGLGAVIAFGVVYNFSRIALSERGREFASLRVLGFTRYEVSYILLGELTILVVVAIPIGFLLGYNLAAFMSRAMETKLFRVPFLVEPATFGISASVVLAAATISALLVAWRISRLDLIAVLKTRE